MKIKQEDIAGIHLYALKKGLAEMKTHPVFSLQMKQQYIALIVAAVHTWLKFAQPEPWKN